MLDSDLHKHRAIFQLIGSIFHIRLSNEREGQLYTIVSFEDYSFA